MVYRRGDGTIGWVEPQRALRPDATRAHDSNDADDATSAICCARSGRRRAGGGEQEGAVPAARPARRRRPTALDAKAVAERLAEREKLGSTGFGGGVAIPHAQARRARRRSSACSRGWRSRSISTRSTICRSIWSFLLLSPPDAGADHLKALARVSRALRDRSVRRQAARRRLDATRSMRCSPRDEARDAA